MDNLYWAIVRKSDNYVTKTYGRCDKISEEDCRFMMGNAHIRNVFELRKISISVI